MTGATIGVAIECAPADKENIDPATGELSPRLTLRMHKKRVALQDITLLVLPKKVFSPSRLYLHHNHINDLNDQFIQKKLDYTQLL
jgi:hypothetical protein